MQSIVAALDRFCILIRLVNIVLLVVLVAALLLINIAQITGRFVFFYSLPWSEETSIYIFIWLIFLGGSIGIRDDSELRLEIIQPKNPAAAARLRMAQDLVSAVIIAVLLVSSVMFMRNALRFRQLSSSLQISMAYIYMVIPIGYALMLLEKITGMAKNFFAEKPKA